jgi:competence ComEA-like helix-hairpin-helix protein
MKTLAGSIVLVLSLSFVPLSFGQDLPAGAGRETLKKVCTQCHDIESVPRLRYTRADWTNLVFSMKDMGADATGAEMDEIIDYLVKNFGKGEAAAVKKVNVNAAPAKDLESGLGFTAKESELIVQYRGKNGNFKDLAALLKVEGVDAAKVQAAKDKMEF